MIWVNSVTVYPKSITLKVGNWSYAAYAEVCPSNADCKEVQWHSDNSSVASVNASSGYICANGVGTAHIYATATDGSGCSDYLTVTVSNTVPVTSVTLNRSSLSLEKGQTSYLYATVCPDNATNKNVTWKSSNNGVATVSSGVVTAVSKGSAKITATAADGSGKSASCTVVVTGDILVTSIELTPSNKTLKVGYSFFPSVTVCPTNATKKSVTWSSANSNIASVNPNSGLVYAKAVGTTTIYASACDGSGVCGCCTVRIIPVYVQDITVCPETLTLDVGESSCLEATVYPVNATNQNVSWISENCNIADVDANGCVTAKSAGTTCICAYATDGSGAHGCCEVTVEVSSHEEMVSALCTKEDCYVRLDTIISNTTANDTRLKKSSGGSVVLRANTSDTVQLLQSAKITDSNGEDWYQILYNGMITYVTADSFDVTTMPKPTFYAVKNMVVNTGDGSNLNVRNKPYITGNLIGKFADQTIVQLMNSTPQNGNWYPVYGHLNNGNFSYGWCSGDYLTDVEDNNLSESQIQEILTNIQNCSTSTIPSNRKEAAVATAQAMLYDGYAPAFVAGMIANIVFEGATGQFESSKYVSNPSAKPDYLVYMDTQYAGTDYYLNNYSGKTIIDVNVQNVYSMLHSLKTTSNDTWRINGSRVGFGLGSIQWTFSRAYTLVQLYLEVNNNQSSISKTQAIEAEKLMIMRELKSSEYRGIVNTWRNKCDNINSADAANIAGSDLCNSYLRPADSTQAQKRATRAEAIYSAMMNSIG